MPDLIVVEGRRSAASNYVAWGLRRSDGFQMWQTANNQLGSRVLSPLRSASEVFFVPDSYDGRGGAQAVDVHTGKTLWQTKETDACRNLIGVYGDITALTDDTGRQLQLVYTRTGLPIDPKRAGDHDMIAAEVLARGGALVPVTIGGRPYLIDLDKATLTPIPLKEAVPAWENPEITRTGSADVIGIVIPVHPNVSDSSAWTDLIVRVNEENGNPGSSLWPKYLVCLRRKGERRWQFPASLSPPNEPGWADRIASAWIVNPAGIAIAQNAQKTLFGVDVNTGKQCWRRVLPNVTDSMAVYAQGAFILSTSQARYKRETSRSSRPFALRRELDYIEARTGQIHHVAELTLGTTPGEFVGASLSVNGDDLFISAVNALYAYNCHRLLRPFSTPTPARKQQAAPLPPSYAFTSLAGLPPNPKCQMQGSQAFAVNNRGQVVGQSWERPVMWQNGRIQELPVLPGDNVGAAYAINNQGNVLIHSERRGGLHDSPVTRDFLLRQGEIVSFSTNDPKVITRLVGLNDAGQVIGQQALSPDVPYSDPARQAFTPRGFVWRNGVTTWLTANPAVSYVLTPLAINNRGQILGELAASSYASIIGPVLWENGWTRKLKGLTVAPTAFNDDGLVVGAVGGTVQNIDDSAVAYNEPGVWQAGRQTALMTAEGADQFTANAVNGQGQVVGSSSRGAFVWQAGQMLFLTSVLPQDSAWVYPVARSINDRGQIVGYRIAQGDSGQGKTVWDNVRSAFLLTPMRQDLPDVNSQKRKSHSQ